MMTDTQIDELVATIGHSLRSDWDKDAMKKADEAMVALVSETLKGLNRAVVALEAIAKVKLAEAAMKGMRP